MKSKLEQYKKFAGNGEDAWAEEEYWPVPPNKMLSFYAVDFLLDFYERYLRLKEKGLNKKDMLALFPNSSYLKCFLINFACMSLKDQKKTERLEGYIRGREGFCNDIIEMIEIEDPDFMKRKGSRDLFSKTRLKTIDKKSILKEKFIKVDAKNEGIISRLKVSAFGLNWGIYGDIFGVWGYFSYGRGPIKYKGENLDISIYKFDHQKPFRVWPKTKLYPYKKIVFYIISDRDKTVGVKYILTKVDNKTLKDEKKYSDLIKKITEVSVKQYQYTESLSELQKIEKMAHLTYYSYREFLGKNWGEMHLKTNKNIKKAGNSFLKKIDPKASQKTFWQDEK